MIASGFRVLLVFCVLNNTIVWIWVVLYLISIVRYVYRFKRILSFKSEWDIEEKPGYLSSCTKACCCSVLLRTEIWLDEIKVNLIITLILVSMLLIGWFYTKLLGNTEHDWSAIDQRFLSTSVYTPYICKGLLWREHAVFLYYLGKWTFDLKSVLMEKILSKIFLCKEIEHRIFKDIIF